MILNKLIDISLYLIRNEVLTPFGGSYTMLLLSREGGTGVSLTLKYVLKM